MGRHKELSQFKDDTAELRNELVPFAFCKFK